MPRKRKECPDGFDKAFPKILRKLMGDEPQQKLADYLGKSRQSISYYRDGTSAPDWEDIVKIADYFKVSTDYLLGRIKDPTPKQDTMAVHEFTGLSSWTIDYLHSYADSTLRSFYRKLFDSIIKIGESELEDAAAFVFEAARASVIARKNKHSDAKRMIENAVISLSEDRSGYIVSATEAESYFLMQAEANISKCIADVLGELENDVIEALDEPDSINISDFEWIVVDDETEDDSEAAEGND